MHIKAVRLISGLVSGAISGAQLQTLLALPNYSGAFIAGVLENRGRIASIAASSTAMTAVAASSTAMTAVAASSTAMTAVAASSTAMTAVAASSTAINLFLGSSYSVGAGLDRLAINGGATTNATLAAQATMTAVAASSTAMTAIWSSNTASDAVLTSTTARLAVYNNDIALAALQANPTQITRQIGIGGRVTTLSTATSSFTYVANGTKVILLRMWITGGAEDPSLCFARGYTGVVNNTTAGIILPLTSENLGKAAVAFGHTPTYTNSGVYPSASNDNANVVAAANGLARYTWSITGNTTQNVIYITV